MKNTNIGIVNLMVSNKLKDSYFNEKLIDESKKIAFDFFDVVKNSPILQLEFKVFNNMEDKYIENDIAATRYIDNNIKLFEVYTIEEIEKEREKLLPFISESHKLNNNDERIKLFNAVDNLIEESLKRSDEINVDSIHESFTYVLNHIKTQKKQLVEGVEVKEIDDNIIEIAVDKFNEKYESLNEDDKNLLQTLIKANDEEKSKLLETYKNDTLQILEGINKENTKDNVAKAIKKIKEMTYRKDNVDDNIISLYELKKEIL
jgi:hypothetical protein